MWEEALENIVGKRENAGNQHFLLFPQRFPPFLKTHIIFKAEGQTIRNFKNWVTFLNRQFHGVAPLTYSYLNCIMTDFNRGPLCRMLRQNVICQSRPGDEKWAPHTFPEVLYLFYIGYYTRGMMYHPPCSTIEINSWNFLKFCCYSPFLFNNPSPWKPTFSFFPFGRCFVFCVVSFVARVFPYKTRSLVSATTLWASLVPVK